MTDKELFEKIRKVLYENMVKGEVRGGRLSFHYTKPSPGRYPFQFFWDTCFHVFILAALGEHDMAKSHLNSLFAMQEDDGFVGHMIYWDRLAPGRLTDVFQSRPSLGRNFLQSHMSALIQPPLAAQAVERVYKVSDDQEFLRQILPKLKKYYRWLAHNRDFDGDGLLTIISPFESGMDWKPTFDVAVGQKAGKADWRLFLKMVKVDFRNYLNRYNLKKIYQKGYFIVKEVGLNTMYAQNLESLAGLCRTLDEQEEANEFSKLSQKVSRSIQEIMYDEKDAAFYDVYGKANTKIRVLTPTVFYPVVLSSVPDETGKRVMDTHFFNSEEFDTPFPLPSAAMKEPSFNPTGSMYIWRGPTWIVNNWFMHRFLIEKGYEKEAERLVNSIRQLIEKSGFREYYNPFTGEGYGAQDFTWAGLVSDMILMEKESSSRKD